MNKLVRLIGCSAMLGGLTAGASAQDEKVDIASLPRLVAQTVQGRFPGATITTITKTIENGEVVYDIEMTRRGRKHEMDVKEDGSIVNFENEIAVKALPVPVVAAVNARYPGCTIKEAMEVMVISAGHDVVEEYEVLIVTADNNEVELAVSPDGRRIE